MKSSDVFNACWVWLCCSNISMLAFLSSAFNYGIYSEPWFQKCPKLTITQARHSTALTTCRHVECQHSVFTYKTGATTEWLQLKIWVHSHLRILASSATTALKRNYWVLIINEGRSRRSRLDQRRKILVQVYCRYNRQFE